MPPLLLPHTNKTSTPLSSYIPPLSSLLILNFQLYPQPTIGSPSFSSPSSSTMRDLFTCYNEQAIRVSDSSCSGSGSSTGSVVSPREQRNRHAPLLSAVTFVYRCTLSTKKKLFVSLTWSKALAGPGLSLCISSSSSSSSVDPIILRKRKGTRALLCGCTAVVVHWDVCNAKYAAGGPEPSEGFHVAVVADGELALLTGDTLPEQLKGKVAESCELVSRRERVSGGILRRAYTTRVRLGGTAGEHEVSVEHGGEEMAVRVDGAEVVRVRRLRWNFRGNHMIFVDGNAVDVMWDVHNWWFGGGRGGPAVFMFRERRGLESRLWIDHLDDAAEVRPPEFSLLIYSNGNTS